MGRVDKIMETMQHRPDGIKLNLHFLKSEQPRLNKEGFIAGLDYVAFSFSLPVDQMSLCYFISRLVLVIAASSCRFNCNKQISIFL